MVLITVTQILRLGGWHLGFRYLQRRRYLRRMLGVTGRRHVASVAKGRGGNVTFRALRCGGNTARIRGGSEAASAEWWLCSGKRAMRTMRTIRTIRTIRTMRTMRTIRTIRTSKTSKTIRTSKEQAPLCQVIQGRRTDRLHPTHTCHSSQNCRQPRKVHPKKSLSYGFDLLFFI